MPLPAVYDAFVRALRVLPGWQKLTARELEVLEAVIIHGEHGTEAAARIVVTRGTFESHWSRIIDKLGYYGMGHNPGRHLEHDLLIEYGRQLERASREGNIE